MYQQICRFYFYTLTSIYSTPSFTLFKVKIASLYLGSRILIISLTQIDYYLIILKSFCRPTLQQSTASDNITTKYCKWTKVRKWLCDFDTSFLVAFHTMLYSFDNIESSVVHCKCKWSLVSRYLKKLKENQRPELKSNVLTTKATEASTILSSPWFIRSLAGGFGILGTVWEYIGTWVSLSVRPC